jgi:hypothetical protein
MNVYIKSFNRPYYLDRCIQSIHLNVIDENLSIIVLDDGTKPEYLERIKAKYTNVTVKISPFYKRKVEKIEKFISEGAVIKEMEIPTEFWLSNINYCKDDFFVVLEDDFWFTEKIDISATLTLMSSNNMCMLKLACFGNRRLVKGVLSNLSLDIDFLKPKFFIENVFLFKNLLLSNPLKIWSILGRFNIVNKYKINYYSIYHVAGAIFSKEYYNYLWMGFKGVVNEDAQLVKALDFYNKDKTTTYGVYKEDIIKTSFSSSATNTFAGINFNPFVYNDLLNKAWFDNELDSMSGYPNDILEKDVERILEKNKNELATIEEWHKWVNSFKDQYRKVGHVL